MTWCKRLVVLGIAATVLMAAGCAQQNTKTARNQDTERTVKNRTGMSFAQTGQATKAPPQTDMRKLLVEYIRNEAKNNPRSKQSQAKVDTNADTNTGKNASTSTTNKNNANGNNANKRSTNGNNTNPNKVNKDGPTQGGCQSGQAGSSNRNDQYAAGTSSASRSPR